MVLGMQYFAQQNICLEMRLHSQFLQHALASRIISAMFPSSLSLKFIEVLVLEVWLYVRKRMV